MWTVHVYDPPPSSKHQMRRCSNPPLAFHRHQESMPRINEAAGPELSPEFSILFKHAWNHPTLSPLTSSPTASTPLWVRAPHRVKISTSPRRMRDRTGTKLANTACLLLPKPNCCERTVIIGGDLHERIDVFITSSPLSSGFYWLRGLFIGIVWSKSSGSCNNGCKWTNITFVQLQSYKMTLQYLSLWCHLKKTLVFSSFEEHILLTSHSTTFLKGLNSFNNF